MPACASVLTDCKVIPKVFGSVKGGLEKQESHLDTEEAIAWVASRRAMSGGRRGRDFQKNAGPLKHGPALSSQNRSFSP